MEERERLRRGHEKERGIAGATPKKKQRAELSNQEIEKMRREREGGRKIRGHMYEPLWSKIKLFKITKSHPKASKNPN